MVGMALQWMESMSIEPWRRNAKTSNKHHKFNGKPMLGQPSQLADEDYEEECRPASLLCSGFMILNEGRYVAMHSEDVYQYIDDCFSSSG